MRISKRHWVIWANYVYPGPKNLVNLDIVPKAVSPYSGESDFFRRVPFGDGSKYIRVTATESDRFPGR